MTALRIATCVQLPEPDADEPILAAALAGAGIEAALVGWDDPRVDWDAPIPTVIRSTWNYVRALPAFLAWIDRASRAAPLWNPPDILRGNVRKRYLLELAARGVAVVPTVLVERGQPVELRERSVIKPEVGAGSFHARAFEPGDPEIAAHVELLAAHSAALVQPYIQSVHDYGERSIVFIDGELTHAIRKAPRFAGGFEQVTGPHPIADDERALAEAALAPVRDRLFYGRVDMARDAGGRPMIMELELVEPSLFFGTSPAALARFIAGLKRRLA
jgi:hypothetical protein